MKLPSLALCFSTVTILSELTVGQSIAEINGNKFLSPYRNKAVSNVTGLVTAKGPDGFWMRSTRPDTDSATSESLYVYDNGTASTNLSTGDIISVDGRITEYRSDSAFLYLTELTKPTVHSVSKGNKVVPLVIGKDTGTPPSEQYTSLDNGDVFGLPNNASQISVQNPTLNPTKYGLDFWESIIGELVTVRKPIAVAKPSKYGDTYVVGDWKTTGKNGRGGLTLTQGDGNPDAIIIGTPLDGSHNPNNTRIGDKLNDITGVVHQVFGTYRILPLTSLAIKTPKKPDLPNPVKFKSNGTCQGLTIGDYNIENFSPNSTELQGRAEHIVKYLNTPDIVFLQEIQDDDGPTDDGEVAANSTLDILTGAISSISSVKYSYIDINPVNDEDGGQPGGNIRVAYLYNPKVLALVNPNPGGPLDATEVLQGPQLSFNPGRVAPNESAWQDSRKPLAAHWRVLKDNSTFFTVNVHFTSKGGSSGIQGDARPPVNGGIDSRLAQANLTAAFVADILAEDSNAAVIMAGDCNEFTFVQPLKNFVAESGLLDLDEAAGIAPVERYTYLFDMNSQELDHMFVSQKIANRSPKLEHMHVNTWVTYADQISDHDPSVAQLNVC